MENVKEYVVTLTAWAIIAGDITVDASSPEEAAKLAREGFEEASWPEDRCGDRMTPVGDSSQPVAVDCVYDPETGEQEWPDESPAPIKYQRADDILAALRAILPYAESRAEDLVEAKEAGMEDPAYPGAADALAAVDAAKALLASLEG